MNQLTQEQQKEYNKCKEDPVYFINNYVKLCEHLPAINLYDYQENLIRHYHENQFSICKAPRQSGKSLTGIAYALHHMLFNDNQIIGLFTMNKSISRNLLDRLVTMFVNLPEWMSIEVIKFNNDEFQLENGSRIILTPMKGWTFNLSVIDELAFINHDTAKELLNAVFPATSKLIISSTPSYAYKFKEVENENGELKVVHEKNIFYKLWSDAILGSNQLKPFMVFWWNMPGKNKEWAERTIKNIGQNSWEQEYECRFMYMTGKDI